LESRSLKKQSPKNRSKGRFFGGWDFEWKNMYLKRKRRSVSGVYSFEQFFAPI
jgi:hypothetical protein